MIFFELLGKIFIEILFQGLIMGLFGLIGKGYDKLVEITTGVKKPMDPMKALENKYLFKDIELTDSINPKLLPGLKGVILEVNDRHKVFAEFYDLNGKQIEWNDEMVFEIGMCQFRLITKTPT
jgi:hypothetical protein